MATYFSLYNGYAEMVSLEPYRDQPFSCSLEWLFGLSVHPENPTEIVIGFQQAVTQIAVPWKPNKF